MIIRPESPRDYSTVANLHLRAFDQRLGESLIVALQRQRHTYDPELSLIAEIDQQIVGHALFTPATIRLMGQPVKVVNLAPIGVEPAFQKQGIGAALITEGHRIARKKGYLVSFLLGHHSYYPRFGYRTGVFGTSFVEVDTESLPKHLSFLSPLLETRHVQESDLPELQRLWLREENLVDFAIEPEDSIIEWISPNPLIASEVYLKEGEIVGYTRIAEHEPSAPRVFLAMDDASAQLIAADIGMISSTLTLPLHPNSASSRTFGGAIAIGWNAGMACPLVANSPLDEFCHKLQKGERVPGRPTWGTAFDLG